MDTAKLETVLTKMLDRVKVANQIGEQTEDFSSEDLLDWPVSTQVKLADSMGIQLDDVDVEATGGPEISEKMQEFLEGENTEEGDGDQLTENMEEFLGA